SLGSNHSHERVNDRRIKLIGALAIDLGNRVADGPRRFVGALLRQRIEHVGNRDDASRKGDVAAADAGVSAAVPSLMMREGDLFGQTQQRKLASRQNPRANCRMTLDDLEFLGRQPADLHQNRVRYADLADVMEFGGTPDETDLRV